MSWEDVPVGPQGGFASRMADDEVSIVMSKVRDTPIYRINMALALFPEGTKALVVRLEKEKKRIGFFKANGTNDRKLAGYSHGSRLIYVCLPRSIAEMGFTKGRYKIKKTDKISDLYFMVRLEDKCGEFPTEQELIEKQKKALQNK